MDAGKTECGYSLVEEWKSFCFHAFPFILWKVSCGYGLQNDVGNITGFDRKARTIL